MKNIKQFFNGFKEGAVDFNKNLTTLINVILLTLVYIIGIGIPSIIAKVSGKHFFDTSRRDTYWLDLNIKKKPLEEYYKQF